MAQRLGGALLGGDRRRRLAVAAAQCPPGILRLRYDACADPKGYRERVSAESPAVPAAARARPAGSREPRVAPGPPLAMRLRPGFWAVLDYGIAFLLALIIFELMFKSTRSYRLSAAPWHARDWYPVLLTVGLAVPVALRRRGPLRAFAVILTACA